MKGIDIILGFSLLWFVSLLFRLHIPLTGVFLTKLVLRVGNFFLNRYKQELTLD